MNLLNKKESSLDLKAMEEDSEFGQSQTLVERFHLGMEKEIVC